MSLPDVNKDQKVVEEAFEGREILPNIINTKEAGPTSTTNETLTEPVKSPTTKQTENEEERTTTKIKDDKSSKISIKIKSPQNKISLSKVVTMWKSKSATNRKEKEDTGGIDKGDGVKVKKGSVSFPKVFLKKSNASGMKRSSSISFGINNKNINNFQQENLVEQQDQDNGSASSPSQKNKRNVWSSLKRSNSMTCGINKINIYSEKSKDQRKIDQINGNVYIEEHIDRKTGNEETEEESGIKEGDQLHNMNEIDQSEHRNIHLEVKDLHSLVSMNSFHSSSHLEF